MKSLSISDLPEPYVDADHAAAFLSISRKTLLALARSKQIPGHPVGDRKRRIWRFRLGELAAWIDSPMELNLDSHQGRVRERKVS
jgi:excisionase family DNA binding protein